MALNIYFTFKGNCFEALKFYADSFETNLEEIIRFSDTYENKDIPLKEEHKNLIMHTFLNICGNKIMFSDTLDKDNFVIGNNLSVAVLTETPEQTKKYFDKLKQGGNISIELQKTSWSECYGVVTDKYGIIWQLYCETRHQV